MRPVATANTRSRMSSSSERNEAFVLRIESSSEERSLALARRLGSRLRPGDVIGLTGDLGAGKTLFVRGLCEGIGTHPDVPVCSPTFSLANIYPGPDFPVCHLDLYRLADEDELEAIGYRDYVDGRGVVAIEWCEQVPGVLPEDHLFVSIAVSSATARSFEFRATGLRSGKLLASLRISER